MGLQSDYEVAKTRPAIAAALDNIEQFTETTR
jgi:hypothetical protein